MTPILPRDDDVSRRALWYYCSRALSEFKIEYLDIARRQHVLDEMAPPSEIQPNFAAPLFTGAAPSSVAWGEGNAFKHYLTSMRIQAGMARQDTFYGTVAAHRSVLDDAETVLRRLHQNGVRGQDRDFSEVFDVNRAALTVFETARGERMRRYWS